ncbi:MAG: FtsX-like permease family protein [Ketobacteraceae bacterium]|nr:FtsX-like permease family protein [Ketobacteraceae bacterium]
MVALSSLQRKLLRELWHIRGQVIAIALVLVGGVGVCIMSLSTYSSLQETRDQYYQEYRFAHIFADLKRAPLSLAERIRDIPDVSRAQARVVAPVTLEVAGFDEPVQGLMTSIPDHEEQARHALNSLHLVRGRLPDSRRDNEVVISDAFAEQHRLQPQDRLTVVINGKRRTLTLVGIVLSPEHIYQIAPGSLVPDFKRYAVMWMPYTPLAKAFDMDGAFNNVVIRMQPGGHQKRVIEHLDALLEPYGGRGAYGREDQLSSRFLREEFKQLQTMAFLFPSIFLGVALFLLNVVITRLINTQREIIATLKAFGYSNRHIFLHYSGMVIAINSLGVLGGYVLGLWLGKGLTALYVDYYRFPDLHYQMQPMIFGMVALATTLICLLATARSVYRAATLAPAEAMRPEAPPGFHHSLLYRLNIEQRLTPATRMIIRQLQRRPVKTFLSVLGLAMACAIMMVGNFQRDAVNFMIHVQFVLQQKQDVEVIFNEPLSESVLGSLRHLPGVTYVEGKRSVPVRLRHGHQEYRTTLEGLPDTRHLQTVLNTELEAIEMPYQGILMNLQLAKNLDVSVGDHVWVETLEGHQEVFRAPVAALTKQFLGLGTYMRQSQLNRYMREGPAINSALLSVDSDKIKTLYRELRDMPAVAGVNLRQSVIDSSYETLDRVVLWFTLINALLGGVIAFGVVYNTIRIALAERGRELASLRVLGYSHGEVAYILLGELALLTLASFPLGFLLGQWLCAFMAANLASDLFRVPLVLTPYTYAFSALIVTLAAVVSGALVWHRLKQLDLVEVLKTRE